MKIGFFDSGLGGLTILKAVRHHLPEYDYVFYGDTEHVPYGDKTEEEIYKFTKEGVERLFEEGALLVIVACNTASSESLRKLQDDFIKNEHPDKRVLGVIIPTVEVLVETHLQRPLLIATTRTVDSKKYEIELKKINSSISLKSVAMPGLAPLIEAGQLDVAYTQIRKAIDMRIGEIDGVILGCTHYTVLKHDLSEVYEFPIISQDEIIPEKLMTYLDNHPEIEGKLSKEKTVNIILSKDSPHYAEIEKSILEMYRE